MASSSGLTALLIIGAGVGGYALWRHLDASKHKVKVKGVFTGAGGKGVDYLNPADALKDSRPNARIWYQLPYQIMNPGGGIRPFEIDAAGGPTGRDLVLPGEHPSGPISGYVLVGGVDPTGCACPQDPTVALARAAGFYAGRGGGGRGYHQQQQQQQQQQDPDGDDQGQYQPPPPQHQHHYGRR